MSTIQANAILDASGGNTTTVNGVTPNSDVVKGRNLIINGDMSVAQRGTSFTPSAGAYTIDRWSYDPSASLSWYTFVQNGDSLTPPIGFSNYIAITSTGANTPSSTQFSVFRQPIEGLNTAQLGWGTSDAKNITISFWVRSTLTGTFAGSLRNNGANYTYPFTYSISAANTWEKKTITVAGATSGTWLTTNGLGVLIGFNLGSGSNYAFTANTWTANWAQTATGSVNLSETSGAKLYLTGVKLEVGSVATEFDHRSYAEELALCQRYLTEFKVLSGGERILIGTVESSTRSRHDMPIATPMRTTPTITTNGSPLVYEGGSSKGFSNPQITAVTNSLMGLKVDISSGTATNSCMIRFNSTSDYIRLDAEL